MIDGLKLTFTGEELIARLEERIRVHQAADTRAELRQARLQALTLIRDHVVGEEVYRLGEYDLRFADLLPDETWLDCGCLERWRHEQDGGEPDDLLTAAAATRRADP
jgi:hypothetical protein